MATPYSLPHNSANKSLRKLAWQGAALALVLVSVFLSFIFPMGDVLSGKDFWQGAREFFPLLTATAAGALGGTTYYLLLQVLRPTGWQKVLAIAAGILLYMFFLWLSLVVGFSATGHWD